MHLIMDVWQYQSSVMYLSYLSAARILFPSLNIRSKCICGKPLFWNSTAKTCAAIGPNISLGKIRSFKSYNFAWNTLVTKSGLSWGSLLGCNTCWISTHFGLHVMVMNTSGVPNCWTNTIASIYCRRISLGPQINDPGSNTLCPTLSPLLSPVVTLSTIPWSISLL